MADSVYKVIELVGTSSESWETAAAGALKLASKSLRDLRVAEISQMDVTLKDGKTMKIDQAGYSDVRTSPVRDDRKAAMTAFFGALGGFSRTMGMTMNSSVQRSLFYSRARKYSSNLEAALLRQEAEATTAFRPDP